MASTYVNDLRLNEMATGDQSGSWGTVTNTNLELIAEAFSYGTEAITTNADTHTTTIADGATDPGRSMFLKYTGTLDSTCTITIGPNTVSKLWFIENATSGSQDIIIKQGSGATVTIASGKTKVIYSDGVGSGAKMVDAFAALDVGSVSVDNITIDGNEIDVSSGDLTLDVAGDIILDADGGSVFFKDAGTEFFKIRNTGSDVQIYSARSDADIKFEGVDGGVGITALTLDMSDAGTATFNHNIKLPDNGVVQFGAGSDIAMYSDGTNGVVNVNNGDLTLDVAGELNIDVDGGAINYKDGGTHFASLEKTGDSLRLEAKISDGDIQFRGNDGGSIITALTLDMSAGGEATFNSGINVGSNATFLGATNHIRADDAYLRIEEADGTDIIFVGDVTGGGVGGSYLYNHGGTATVQIRADQASTVTHGIDLNNTGTPRLTMTSSSGPYGFIEANTVGSVAISADGGNSGSNTNITFKIDDTERLRINSSGRQSYNGSSTANGHGNFVGEVGTSSKALMFEHTNGGGEVGSIRTTSSTAVYYGDGSNLTGVGGSTDYGAVGTYVWAGRAGSTVAQTPFVNGSTYAGSTLYPQGLATEVADTMTTGIYGFHDGFGIVGAFTTGGALSGTWRAMGRTPPAPYDEIPMTLFVRIS